MMTYDEFYPSYMGEDDIDIDISIMDSTSNYRQYKADGGFLDKLTYFEVLSQVRENRKVRTRPYSRKVERIRVGEKAVLKDASGDRYSIEPGDFIEGKVNE